MEVIKKIFKVIGRILLVLLILIVIALIVCFFYQKSAQKKDRKLLGTRKLRTLFFPWKE